MRGGEDEGGCPGGRGHLKQFQTLVERSATPFLRCIQPALIGVTGVWSGGNFRNPIPPRSRHHRNGQHHLRFRWQTGSLPNLTAKGGESRANPHGPELRQHGKQAAQRLLQEGLRRAKLHPSQPSSLKDGDPRKAQIAATLHTQTTVPLAWIAQALHTGTPSNVSQACKRCVKP